MSCLYFLSMFLWQYNCVSTTCWISTTFQLTVHDTLYHWIGRGEPVAWPIWSFELNPLSFCLWLEFFGLWIEGDQLRYTASEYLLLQSEYGRLDTLERTINSLPLKVNVACPWWRSAVCHLLGRTTISHYLPGEMKEMCEVSVLDRYHYIIHAFFCM